MKRFLEIIFNACNFIIMLVYPNRCIFCEEILPIDSEKTYICSCCSQELMFCEASREDRIKAVYEYRGKMKNMIHRLKFRFHPEYADFAAEMLLEDLDPNLGIDFNSYDYIVPVPVHIKRERARGFNQSELIAKAIGKRTGVEVSNKLIRIRNTAPQLGLSSKERAENIKGAFKVVKSGCFKDKRIIIIDDIYTTGSTVRECIKTIEVDGCERVDALCLSKVSKIIREDVSIQH